MISKGHMDQLDAIRSLVEVPAGFTELNIKTDLATGKTVVTVTPADLAAGTEGDPVNAEIDGEDLAGAMGMEPDGEAKAAPKSEEKPAEAAAAPAKEGA